MVERGRGQLDLSARRRVPILGDHLVQQLELDAAQHGLVLFREAAALGDERANASVVVQIQRVDPGQLLPHLQVAQIVRAEARGRRAPVGWRRLRAAAPREKLPVAGVDVDHVLALGVEEVLQDEIDVVVIERRGRLETQLEIPVTGAVLGKRLELHEQRRDEVERHLDVGTLAQDGHHAVIVLEGVQPDPRQDVLVGREVLVIRLVHMPQDGDTGHTL